MDDASIVGEIYLGFNTSNVSLRPSLATRARLHLTETINVAISLLVININRIILAEKLIKEYKFNTEYVKTTDSGIKYTRREMVANGHFWKSFSRKLCPNEITI